MSGVAIGNLLLLDKFRRHPLVAPLDASILCHNEFVVLPVRATVEGKAEAFTTQTHVLASGT